MKKKIEVLMQDSRLVGNAAFKQLQTGYQSAKNTTEKAKSEKSKAKLAYRNATEEAGKKNRDTRIELRTAFHQAKYMQQYHKAAFQLAEYRLCQWLENWLSEMPEPHAASQSKQKKALKSPKAASTPTAKAAPKSGPAPTVKKKTIKAKPKPTTQA